jgi:hypothetical protein
MAASIPHPEGLRFDVRHVATHKIPDNASIRDQSCRWVEKIAITLRPGILATFATFAAFVIFAIFASLLCQQRHTASAWAVEPGDLSRHTPHDTFIMWTQSGRNDCDGVHSDRELRRVVVRVLPESGCRQLLVIEGPGTKASGVEA